MDLSKIDLNQFPKTFCEGALTSHGRNVFEFAFVNGNQIIAFATTPQVMKEIVRVFSEQLSKYQAQFGEIDMSQPLIQSPIQISDLQKPDQEGSDKK